MRIKRPWAHGRPVSGEEEVDQVHQADAHHVGAQQQRQGVDAPAGGAGGGLVVASPYSPSLPGAPFLQTQPFLFQPLDLGTGPALVNIHYSQILGQPSLEPQNMSGEGDESPVGARKDLKFSRMCVHDRQRWKCRDCKGSQICVHDRERSKCRDCKGSQICVHDRRRSVCKECKGTSICPHSRERRKCKECKAARTMAALAAVVHQELQEMGGEPDEIPAAGLGFAHLGAFPPMALGEALPAGAVRGAAMGHTASASALSTSSSLFPAPSPSASSHTASVFAAPSFAAAGAAAPLKNELDDGGLPPALLLPVRG